MALVNLRDRLFGMDINDFLHTYYIHNNPVTKTSSLFWYGKDKTLRDSIHGYPDPESARQDAQNAINEIRTEHPPTRDNYYRYTLFEINHPVHGYPVGRPMKQWGVKWYKRDGSVHCTIPGFHSYEQAIKTSDNCWKSHNSELQTLPVSMLDPLGRRRPLQHQPSANQTSIIMPPVSNSSSYRYSSAIPLNTKTFDEKWADGIKAFVKDSK